MRTDCRPLAAAIPAACSDLATDSAYRCDSANYVATASLSRRLCSSYNYRAVPTVADASVVGLSDSAAEVSAEHKLRFVTDARSAIEHARNQIVRCSVEAATDTADFYYSLHKAGKSPCKSTRFDERAPTWGCFCLSSD